MSGERYIELFRQALRIRLVEERIIALYPSDCIQSPVHLSIGQEAVAVGLCAALRREDLLFPTYRGHALYLAKGGDLPAMMAELYGRRNGVSQGKAGSMHLTAPEVGMMGASAVVASTIPHAVGAALAAKLARREQICVAVFGEGATEEGCYHESLNFAALQNVPVLFVCENNGLAVHARQSERQSFKVVDHVRAYGIPARQLQEGWDFVAVADAAETAIEGIRRDGRPRFLEVMTCRYREHVGPGEDFAAGYRAREEVAMWMTKDPLVTDTALCARMRPAIEREIDLAVAFAETGPVPSSEELLVDVY
jgi:pyruvate dehydrogenase E1 component alpha subunit